MNDSTTERQQASWWQRLSGGLKRTSASIGGARRRSRAPSASSTSAMLDEIEEVLIRADLGVDSRGADRRRRRRGPLRQGDHRRRGEGGGRRRGREGADAGGEAARRSTRAKPFVILVVGVNGSGKTTTIGKLAAKFRAEGRTVMLAAGDTFRAAAIEQLKIWGGRTGATVIARDAGRGCRRPRLRRADAGARRGASTCCWSTPPAACRTAPS